MFFACQLWTSCSRPYFLSQDPRPLPSFKQFNHIINSVFENRFYLRNYSQLWKQPEPKRKRCEKFVFLETCPARRLSIVGSWWTNSRRLQWARLFCRPSLESTSSSKTTKKREANSSIVLNRIDRKNKFK